MVLVKAIEKVSAKTIKSPITSFEEEFKVGFNILLDALKAPLAQIAVNAGKGDGSIIVEKVKEGKGNIGYDAASDEIVSDMIAKGIIDPVKVTRSCVQYAASAAAVLLTTEAAVTDEPKEEKSPDMGAMGGMGGGMPGMGF